jgi:hypothetical protein
VAADDVRALAELNERIGEAENRGDREWLESVLAPKLAFQRADEARTVDDRVAFLEKVAPGGRRTTRVGPIQVQGDRALVECVVSVGDDEFHNLRLFVRRGGDWKLLGWANEKLAKTGSHVLRAP